MQVLLQKVHKASTAINNKNFSLIDNGILVFVGIQTKDSLKDV
jgi:D-Tyr-tRNAtyr deacylase